MIKYWETETPIEVASEKSVVKFYPENGKVQFFPVVKSAARGIGKGVTLDLTAMTELELKTLAVNIKQAVDKQLAKDGE